jgi:hypothetical protein
MTVLLHLPSASLGTQSELKAYVRGCYRRAGCPGGTGVGQNTNEVTVRYCHQLAPPNRVLGRDGVDGGRPEVGLTCLEADNNVPRKDPTKGGHAGQDRASSESGARDEQAAVMVNRSGEDAWEETVKRVRRRREEFDQLDRKQIDEIIDQDFQKIKDPSVREGVIYGVLRDLGRSHEEIVATLKERRITRAPSNQPAWPDRLMNWLQFNR